MSWWSIWLALWMMLAAVDTPVSPPINADNIDQLRSVAQIDFADLPEGAGRVINGQFLLADNGERLSVVNRGGVVLVLDLDGNLIGQYQVRGADELPANFIDGTFDPTGDQLATLHTDGQFYYLAIYHIPGAALEVLRFEGLVTAVWFSGESIWLAGENGFLTEVGPDRALTPYQLDSPQTDPDSLIRIGRLPAPLAVSVTRDALVKRWDLQTGALTAEVQVDLLPLYGHTTPDGAYLLWRDPASTVLSVLDFEAGINRRIVPLNGTYIPFLFLSMTADVIIGVDVDEQPIVTAWSVETGLEYDLGPYRACNRPPDMARLSRDGTTLVVGCDLGLDILRIADSTD